MSNNIIATLPGDVQHAPSNMSHYRKEDKLAAEYAALAILPDGSVRQPVTLRLYATANTVYACLWVQGTSCRCIGVGKAGGYGYHKASAAAGAAIKAAGITLSDPINGRGDAAIADAVKAIGKAASLAGATMHVHHAHG